MQIGYERSPSEVLVVASVSLFRLFKGRLWPACSKTGFGLPLAVKAAEAQLAAQALPACLKRLVPLAANRRRASQEAGRLETGPVGLAIRLSPSYYSELFGLDEYLPALSDINGGSRDVPVGVRQIQGGREAQLRPVRHLRQRLRGLQRPRALVPEPPRRAVQLALPPRFVDSVPSPRSPIL